MCLFFNQQKMASSQLKWRKAMLSLSIITKAVFKTAYCTSSTHWFGKNVVCSMLYVNPSKIFSMPKSSRMYTDLEEIPSVQSTSLPRLPQCNALRRHNQSPAVHLLIKTKKEKKLLLPIWAKCILVNLPVYRSVNRWLTDCPFSMFMFILIPISLCGAAASLPGVNILSILQFLQ